MISLLLKPFLSALEESGLRCTCRDYERVHLALAAAGEWRKEQVRSILLALLAKDMEQRETFSRVFDGFFPGDWEHPQSLEPVEFDRFFTDLKRLVGPRPFLVPKTSPILDVPGPMTTSDRSEARPTPSSAQSEARPSDAPSPGELPARLICPDTWIVPGTIDIEISSESLPPEEPLPDPKEILWEERGPLHFSLLSVSGRCPRWLTDADLDELADAMCYFQTETAGTVLNVPRSIQGTLDHGGIPILAFQRGKRVRALFVLEDTSSSATAWNRLPGELAEGMSQRGVPVLQGWFSGSPHRFWTDEGRACHLEDFEDERVGCVLLVFTDGSGLYRPESAWVFEELACWPKVAWMDLREPRFWDETTDRARKYVPADFPGYAGRASRRLTAFPHRRRGS